MKKILFLALIFVSIQVEAQPVITIPDSIHMSVVPETITVPLSVSGGVTVRGGSGILYGESIPYYGYRNDTIKVVLLISDTSSTEFRLYIAPRLVLQHVKELRNTQYSPMVFWVFGYAVYSKQGREKFLDSSKKPFDKNIVVWMSKHANGAEVLIGDF